MSSRHVPIGPEAPDVSGFVTAPVITDNILDGTIEDADINAAAGIAYSKLDLANSITSSDIATGTIVDSDINVAAGIADTKLASSTLNTFRNLLRGSVIATPTVGGTVGTFMLQANGVVDTAAASNGNMAVIRLDANDLAVAGKTTRLRVKAVITTNGTSVGVTTITVGLYPITAYAGAAAVLTQTVGAVVAGSTFAAVNPGTNLLTTMNSAEFNIPSNGYYQLGYTVSSGFAVNSLLGLSVVLEAHYV